MNISNKCIIDPVIGTAASVYTESTVMGRLEELVDHAHKSSACYPVLAAGITITKAAGAWAAIPAIKTEIVPVDTITSPFDIHFLHCNTISGTGEYVLNFYKGLAGAEILIGQACLSRSTTHSAEGSIPVQTPIQLANTRISVAISGSPAGTENIVAKIMYHTY